MSAGALLYGTDADAARILEQASLWFIVGLGNNPERAAFGVAQVLQRHGKRIIPIYPRAEMVHGEQGYATIGEAASAVGTPDVVDCFVRSDRVGQFVNEAIAVGAPALWMQLDVIDEAAAQRAVDAGLTVIMDRCPVIELRRLGR
jgi:predicted CoA-binding protein